MCKGVPPVLPFSTQRASLCNPPPLACSLFEDDADFEPFNCAICLDLVQEPVVQCCGHILCLLCAFGAMNPKSGNSRCPVCRRRYHHLPRLCRLLHSALIKLYSLPSDQDQDMEGSSASSVDTLSAISETLTDDSDEVEGKGEFEEDGEEKVVVDKEGTMKSDSDGCPILSTKDFPCALCSKLVYRPLVLNCGEVFCESCVKTKSPDFTICPSCNSIQFDGAINICLELDDFLGRTFPDDYAKRRDEVAALEEVEQDDPQLLYISRPVQTNMHIDESETALVHEGIVCDGCGMYPIEGVRYQCKDCVETTGFDLCAFCYSIKDNDSKTSHIGHFGQEHHVNHHQMIRKAPPFLGLSTRSTPLQLNLNSGTINQRRHQQYNYEDVDFYF